MIKQIFNYLTRPIYVRKKLFDLQLLFCSHQNAKLLQMHCSFNNSLSLFNRLAICLTSENSKAAITSCCPHSCNKIIVHQIWCMDFTNSPCFILILLWAGALSDFIDTCRRQKKTALVVKRVVHLQLACFQLDSYMMNGLLKLWYLNRKLPSFFYFNLSVNFLLHSTFY